MLRVSHKALFVAIGLTAFTTLWHPSSRSTHAQETKLPKVKRSLLGPTLLEGEERTVLVKDPEKCKGKEYQMEVTYAGGGIIGYRKDGLLEWGVFYVGDASGSDPNASWFQMDFSFPNTITTHKIKAGDSLLISFVFGGKLLTSNFPDQRNVVTAAKVIPKK